MVAARHQALRDHLIDALPLRSRGAAAGHSVPRRRHGRSAIDALGISSVLHHPRAARVALVVSQQWCYRVITALFFHRKVLGTSRHAWRREHHYAEC